LLVKQLYAINKKMAEQGSYYSSNSEYAFPGSYSPEADEELFFVRSSKPNTNLPFTLKLDPRSAIIKYNESLPGQWQARQTARYPGFHRDLKPALIPKEFEGREEVFKHQMLGIMALENYEQFDRARFDLHPIGHMALVTCQQEQLLIPAILSGSVQIGPGMLDVVRHAAPLHDIAETEYPGVVVEHGSALGDIGADRENDEEDGKKTRGKTDADRQKEHDILVSLLKNMFSEEYTPEMQEMLVKFICHRIEGESPEFVRAHGMGELGHCFNSIDTGIYYGTRAVYVDSIYGNLMSALSEQHIRILKPKIQSVFDHSPELIAPLKYRVDAMMRDLKAAAHSRDGDRDFIKWRTSDKITTALNAEYASLRWS
jgi:hypothetical protein